LDILTDLDHPDAAKIHTKLERLPASGEGPSDRACGPGPKADRAADERRCPS
jgi:hypothetical protein